MIVCPVCGYELDEQPWVGDSASDEICPSCGIQFGYDDAIDGTDEREKVYRDWRTQWIAAGMPWFSQGTPPPATGWDPRRQLERVTRAPDTEGDLA